MRCGRMSARLAIAFRPSLRLVHPRVRPQAGEADAVPVAGRAAAGEGGSAGAAAGGRGGWMRRRPRRRSGGRDERLHQPTRRRRRGLSTSRPHARLPRQAESKESQNQRADGCRLQLGTPCPPRARSDEGKQGPGLGSSREKIESRLTFRHALSLAAPPARSDRVAHSLRSFALHIRMTHQLGLAVRRLRATPGFTAISVGSLAVATGLNILIFSFTSPVLFKALPYPEPDRLLDVSMAPPGKPESKGVVTPALYLLLRDKTNAAFEAVGAFDAGWSANLAGDAGGPAERLDGHRMSATGLAAPGARPRIGRLPAAADEQAGAAPTMVLSYPVWQRRFGGRPDVVGRTVQVDG